MKPLKLKQALLKEELPQNWNYYRSELSRVSFDSDFTPVVKITSSKGSTKEMNLNKESIPVLIKWLQDALKTVSKK
tara:strand:+ start:99 stop:326 length:228 start_codon:yes stop_codon:yes gene_type:complete